ncbi:MAG TPA: RNA-binding protein [Planctomycetota bacterium]|nr:RNA-binding protein [Planctomycetota bacterium]
MIDLHVGNLSAETTQEDLRKAFSAHGVVTSVTILTEQRRGGLRTGRSLGFGFVAMADPVGARAAIAALDRHDLRGSLLTVQKARPVRISRHRR